MVLQASSVHRITLPTPACRAALSTAKASSVLSMSTSSRPEESEVNQGKTSFQESYGSSPSVTDEPDKLYRQLDLEVRIRVT